VTGPEFYLPHCPLVRSKATTTKIRPVFDASAQTEGGLSLNDFLETGENLNPELLAVLLRFRWHRVAWVGDIEKAFLQIEIHSKDRDALRFICIDDLSNSSLEKEPSIFRWNRVTFDLSSSPFILRIVIRNHLKTSKELDPPLARYIEECLYMDDLLAGSESAEEAIKTINCVQKVFKRACMRLTKWVTNDLSLADSLKETKSTSTGNDLTHPIGYEETEL